MGWFLSAMVAFAAGSIPWGLWIGRWVRGIDVREHGSGNLGATNVYRVLGPSWGILVLLLDAAKGVLAVYAARGLTHSPSWGALLGLAAAVLGHSFSPLARFRGGKGVATAAGAWGAVAPLPLGAALTVFILVFGLTRVVSLGSLLAALALPAGVALLGRRGLAPGADPVFYFALLTTLLVALRHRSNIARLLRGEEKALKLRGGKRAGEGTGSERASRR